MVSPVITKRPEVDLEDPTKMAQWYQWAGDTLERVADTLFNLETWRGIVDEDLKSKRYRAEGRSEALNTFVKAIGLVILVSNAITAVAAVYYFVVGG